MADKNIDIDISADSSGYRRGADEAKKITRDLNVEFDKSNKVLSTIGSVAMRMGGVVASAASIAGAGLIAAGGSALLLAKNAATTADEMAILSKRTGMAAEDLGAWRLATAQSGTSLDGLADGLKDLSRYMAEHEDNLRRLGITANTSEGALIQLAGVLSSMRDDDSRRLALANKVLGDSYQKLMPLFAEGEDGLRQLVERGRELNPVTNELAREASLFSGQLEELKLSASGLGASVATRLLPHLNDIVAKMREAARESGILKAVWEGMKGTFQHAFGLDDMSKARQRLQAIKVELIQIHEFLNSGKATATHTRALIPRLKELGIEKANLLQLLDPTPPETIRPPAPSADVLDSILKPSGRGASRTSRSGGSSSEGANPYLEEMRDLAELIKEVGKLTEGEKSHIQVLQDKVNAYSSLDPAVKSYLQTTIDQASQMEQLKLFEGESKKLLQENENLNVGLLESDRERVQAQLKLEHERSLSRIRELQLESEQVQALIEQETKNYELRMKKAQTSTEKTSDVVKSKAWSGT